MALGWRLRTLVRELLVQDLSLQYNEQPLLTHTGNNFNISIQYDDRNTYPGFRPMWMGIN